MPNILRLLRQGFNPAEVAHEYGDTLTFWDWKARKVTQSIKLGADGLFPLVWRPARSARALVGTVLPVPLTNLASGYFNQTAEVRCCP